MLVPNNVSPHPPQGASAQKGEDGADPSKLKDAMLLLHCKLAAMDSEHGADPACAPLLRLAHNSAVPAVCGLQFEAYGLGFTVQSLGFRVEGLGLRV